MELDNQLDQYEVLWKKAKKEARFAWIRWLGDKNPKLAEKIIRYGAYVVVFLGGGLATLFGIYINTSLTVQRKTNDIPSGFSSKKDEFIEDNAGKVPFEVKANNEKFTNKCNGAEIEINFSNFKEIGGERFVFNEKTRDYSAPKKPGYQASFETVSECDVNSEVKINILPVGGQSLGLFYELHDVFKVVVGDGDRKTVKLLQNSSGKRDEWAKVYRKSLLGEILSDKEMVLIINTKYEQPYLSVEVKIYYSGNTDPESLGEVKFIPQKANLSADSKRISRFGINDWRYKGKGSILNFKTLSITETKKN